MVSVSITDLRSGFHQYDELLKLSRFKVGSVFPLFPPVLLTNEVVSTGITDKRSGFHWYYGQTKWFLPVLRTNEVVSTGITN